MEIRELTCIGCPLGCALKVEIENGKVINVTGNTCPKGKTYAEKEVTNPTRVVTSTVRVENGERPLAPVKTKEDVPKSKIFDCMAEINKAVAKAPIKTGDVIIENVAGTGVAVIAAKDIKAV